MSVRIAAMAATETEATTTEATTDEHAGIGAMATSRGNLPLEAVDAKVRITGLVSQIDLTQSFSNPHDVALEATYVFPLPDRAAVTAMRMIADGHVIEAELKERERARDEYDQAIAAGQRASIAEQERPDVFTMRVGNIVPGERVTVELTVVGPLSYEDGEATFRLPLVVAPRYIPGTPLVGESVGGGYAPDTDAVPDASRITPPVLLPGFPHPVQLSIGVDIDATGLPLAEVRSSLHAVVQEGDHIAVRPGERLNRDFVLRLAYGEPDAATNAFTITPDAGGHEATFRLTILPPTTSATPRPRDVVLLLDRSGSMTGWKMVAARRAAARIIDTLTSADRFAVIAFDHVTESPPALASGLVAATDRHRFRAVEHLAAMQARGGTELLAPLTQALALLTEAAGDRVLVLVTDGQVGNEDQIIAGTASSLSGIRVHTVGIDQAVNAGFLGRLAAAGGGRCELVESEDRLDEAMRHIHRRIGSPIVTDVTLHADGLQILDATVSPARLPDLFPGAPVVITGRLRGDMAGSVLVRGTTADAAPWSLKPTICTTVDSAVAALWARAHLRDLEDAYLSGDHSVATAGRAELEQRMVEVSLRFGVLCRFTAWLAVDARVVNEGGDVHRVTQPIEQPAGWDMFDTGSAVPMLLAASAAPMRPAMDMLARAITAPATTARARRTSQRPPKPAAPDELATLRALAVDELRRLREIDDDAPLRRRREALADLGTRLQALLRHLTGAGAVARGRAGGDAAALASLSDLVGALEADQPLRVPDDVVHELWTRTLRVLEEFAAARATGRRAFWKRG